MRSAPRARVRAAGDWLAAKLSRVTSSGDLIPEVDGLRFLAIAAVIFHHAMSIYLPKRGRFASVRTPAEWFTAAEQNSWLIYLAYSGHFGVQLFFVISGFILALPFARRYLRGFPRPPLKSYFLRRLTRLEPPYILSLLVYFVYQAFKEGNGAERFPHLLARAFYLHGAVFGSASRINEVAWSLEIEIQFYLLVPLLVTIFKIPRAWLRRALLLALILTGGLVTQKVFTGIDSQRLWHSIPPYLHYFLTGFLLADFYLTTRDREPARTHAWDFATLAGAAGILLALTRYGQIHFLLPFFVALLYTGFFMGRASNWLIRRRWIVIIGGMCYTLYLYHTMILGGALSLARGLVNPARPFLLDFAMQAALTAIPILLICGLLYALVEKPFMRWRVTSRREAAPLAGVAGAD
ncbi:MAG: acyltransferase family protein [Blastocatellia bacterium]